MSAPSSEDGDAPVAPAPRGGVVGLLKRTWPWLVGIAILIVIGSRVPVAAFRDAISQGPHLQLAAVEVVISVLVLGTDTWSTWVGLLAVRLRRPFRNVLVVRGATYLLYILNYAVAQGGFGYYLHRTGTPALRAVGITLFLIGTNLATMLVFAAAVWAIHGVDAANQSLWWMLAIGCGAFAVYLVVIVLAPRWLADRQVLAPLFDAGLGGHAVAMAGRLPHTIAVVLAHWAAMRVWGIEVPFWVAITMMPAVAIVGVLPISPAGLGTTQAAMVYFFAPYASGVSADDRAAAVLAFAIVHYVYGVLASLAIGLVCTPLARRQALLEATAAPPSPDGETVRTV